LETAAGFETIQTVSESCLGLEFVEHRHPVDDMLPVPPSADMENPFEGVGATGLDVLTSNKLGTQLMPSAPQQPMQVDEQAYIQDTLALEEALLGDPIIPISLPKDPPGVEMEQMQQQAADFPEQPTSAHTSRRPSSTALMPRPTSLLPVFHPFSSPFLPATESATSSPLLRPRSAIPFGARPSHLRHHSMSTANYLGLHEDHLFAAPLQDALFGFNSRPQSSRNSPALRPVTAHAMLPPPLPARTTSDMSASASGRVAAEEKEGKTGKKEKGLKRKLRRQRTEGTKDSGGVNAIPGMMIFAAGVTIASSMFHRRG
jgi:hypothetical protein